MKLLWLTFSVIGIAGVIGMIYVGMTPGDQTLIGGLSGMAAMMPVCAVMGYYAPIVGRAIGERER